MGIFGTPSEEEKNLKKLIKAINGSAVSYEWREVLKNYVEDVYNGRKVNAFFNWEFLNDVILNLSEWTTGKNLSDLEKVIKAIKFMLPEGEKSEDYESIKRLIISSLTVSGGILEDGIFDATLYCLFDNKRDYLTVMNLIKEEGKLDSYEFEVIRNYAVEVAVYCANNDIFRNEVINFIEAVTRELDDVYELKEQRLVEAKKRAGVYAVDEKTLARISGEVDRIASLVTKLKALQKKVETYEDTIATLTADGKRVIKEEARSSREEIGVFATNSIERMQASLEENRKMIVDKLDEYLLTLEANLKKSSDQVFRGIIGEAQSKIREIKLAAESLSQTTSSDLLRIQNTAEESVARLQSYVQEEPKLKKLLDEARTDEVLKEALMKFNKAQETITASTVVTGSRGILIPGHDRFVVPANPNVIIPENPEQIIIIPAFDETIPFDIRMGRILAEMKRREANGEIFHEMTEEVIRCIIEGDWVYLWGPSGCGKSYSFKQMASLIGIDMIDNGKVTDKYSVMAYNDPHGNFRATQAFVGLTYGKMLVFDEFDNGNTDTQVTVGELYSALISTLEKPHDPKYVTFGEDMSVPVHPNFRMISAGNTSGAGENQIFSSRGKLDEAVQERMTPKKFNYDNRVEQRIFGDYTEWYNLFVNFRKACDAYAKKQGWDVAPGITTTRDAAAIAKYIKHNSKSVSQVLREKFVQTKDASYLKFLMKQLKEIYEIDNEEVTQESYVNMTQINDVEEKGLAMRLILECDSAAKGERR